MFFKIKKLENIRFRAEQQVRCPLRSYSVEVPVKRGVGAGVGVGLISFSFL